MAPDTSPSDGVHLEFHEMAAQLNSSPAPRPPTERGWWNAFLAEQRAAHVTAIQANLMHDFLAAALSLKMRQSVDQRRAVDRTFENEVRPR